MNILFKVINNNECGITGLVYLDPFDPDKDRNIEIPLTCNSMISNDKVNFNVTKISCNAFEGYDVSKITIPHTVDTIEDNAFANCENLESIKCLGKIIHIGPFIFGNCHSLKEFDFKQSGIDETGYGMFHGCTSLKKVILPVGEKTKIYIKPKCFYNCYSLKEVIGDKYISNIDESSFALCSSLESIDLSNCIEIRTCAFSKCFNLKNIKFGPSLERIERCAFNLCTSLEEVVFPKTNEKLVIRDNIFINCVNLKRVVFEGNNIEISNRVFDCCVKLKEIIVSGKVLKPIDKYNLNFKINN